METESKLWMYRWQHVLCRCVAGANGPTT